MLPCGLCTLTYNCLTTSVFMCTHAPATANVMEALEELNHAMKDFGSNSDHDKTPLWLRVFRK